MDLPLAVQTRGSTVLVRNRETPAHLSGLPALRGNLCQLIAEAFQQRGYRVQPCDVGIDDLPSRFEVRSGNYQISLYQPWWLRPQDQEPVLQVLRQLIDSFMAEATGSDDLFVYTLRFEPLLIEEDDRQPVTPGLPKEN